MKEKEKKKNMAGRKNKNQMVNLKHMNNYIYKLQITFKKQDPVYAAHKKPTIYYR